MQQDEQEEKAKTYTPSGKRKFKAKVIQLSTKGESLFKQMQNGTEEVKGEKFELTEHDFTVKSQEEETFIRPESQETPSVAEEEEPPSFGEDFKPTKKNYQKEE